VVTGEKQWQLPAQPCWDPNDGVCFHLSRGSVCPDQKLTLDLRECRT